MSLWDREQGSRSLWPALLQLQHEEWKHSFRPFPYLFSASRKDLSEPICAKQLNTTGAFAAFRINTTKMCVWRSRVTATSRWSSKSNNLISATIYLRLTALLPWCFWAVGNTGWRTQLNWDNTRCRLNGKCYVILEVTIYFGKTQGKYTSKDNEIFKKVNKTKQNLKNKQTKIQKTKILKHFPWRAVSKKLCRRVDGRKEFTVK